MSQSKNTKKKQKNQKPSAKEDISLFLNTLPECARSYNLMLETPSILLKCNKQLRLPFLQDLQLMHSVSPPTLLADRRHFLPCLTSFTYYVTSNNYRQSLVFLNDIIKEALALTHLTLRLQDPNQLSCIASALHTSISLTHLMFQEQGHSLSSLGIVLTSDLCRMLQTNIFCNLRYVSWNDAQNHAIIIAAKNMSGDCLLPQTESTSTQ